MNKKVMIVLLTIIFLVAVIVISLKLSQSSMEIQKEILNNAQILLTDGNKEIILNKEVIELSTEENFDAVLDTSTTEPRVYTYTGVQLKNLILDNNINLHNKEMVLISAVDGYSVAYSIDEILLEKNIYIAYMEDDKYLKNRDAGGRGPYESIVVSDMFSNRRCKWITKIEVK